MSYLTLVLFGVANVVTSVFVESVIMASKHYRDLIVQEKQHEKAIAVMHVKEVFKAMDQDNSGGISADEMEFFLAEPALNHYVEALGISAENTRMLFRLMDGDGSGRIDLDEFCEGCLRLQGEARSVEVHILLFQIRAFLCKWSDFTEYVEERFATMGVLMGEHSAKEVSLVSKICAS